MVNFILYGVGTIVVWIIINIIFRIYKLYKFSSAFSISIDRFISVDVVFFSYIFKCKNIKTSPVLKWKSKNNYILILTAIIDILYKDKLLDNKALNHNICLTFFNIDPSTNLYVPISEACEININNISANDLFNLIKWHDIAFDNCRTTFIL